MGGGGGSLLNSEGAFDAEQLSELVNGGGGGGGQLKGSNRAF